VACRASDGDPGCASRAALPPRPAPGWLEPGELERWHAEHPWLVPLAAAPMALRRVALVMAAGPAADLRISGPTESMLTCAPAPTR
jgi:hypothetical protein